MNLDDRFILVFVRQNMFQDHQMVHCFHLGLLIGKAVDGYCQKRHVLTGHPNVLVFGATNEDNLVSLSAQLRTLQVEVIEWRDPDAKPKHDDFGLVGLVTEPITKTTRNKIPRFKQWSAVNNTHPKASLEPDAVFLLSTNKKEVITENSEEYRQRTGDGLGMGTSSRTVNCK